MHESDYARKFKDIAKKEGWFVISLAGSFYGVNGIPDAMFMKDGKLQFIEFKGSTTPIRPLQEAMMKKIRAAGITVKIVRFLSDSFYVNEDYHIHGIFAERVKVVLDA